MDRSVTDSARNAPAAPATVLIIDDEREVRDSIAAYLEDCDYRVLEAADGAEGLELAERHHPDLILCDLRMPRMDGLSVLDRITREHPETPFIMLSGMGLLGEAVDALKRGAWDYLSKPVGDLAVLGHAIHQALERARLLRKNREYQEHLERTNERLEQSLRQMQEDEAAGRRIQFQLLPEDNFLHEGYRFRRRLLTSMYLSGDFVDWFVLDDRQIGFYFADVSGHGVSSAFVTVLLKSYMSRYLELFRQGKSRGLLDPAKILSRLNRNILKSNMGKYLTMFYGLIDWRTNHMRYAVGGQFPPPMLFDGQEIRFIADRNVPVGLFDFAEYANLSMELPPQFSLTLISDGIIDTLPPELSLQDKLERLRTLVATSDGDDLDVLLAHLGLAEPAGPLPDDITVLRVSKS